MNEEQLRKFETTRAKGRKRFVVFHILAYVMIGVVWAALMSAFFGNEFWKLLPMRLAIFSTSGIAGGWLRWGLLERRFNTAMLEERNRNMPPAV